MRPFQGSAGAVWESPRQCVMKIITVFPSKKALLSSSCYKVTCSGGVHSPPSGGVVRG